nr:hypothetical protein [Sulfitobacter sp. SK012]
MSNAKSAAHIPFSAAIRDRNDGIVSLWFGSGRRGSGCNTLCEILPLDGIRKPFWLRVIIGSFGDQTTDAWFHAAGRQASAWFAALQRDRIVIAGDDFRRVNGHSQLGA